MNAHIRYSHIVLPYTRLITGPHTLLLSNCCSNQ